MASERLPSYVQVHKRASGQRAYYWVRPRWASPPTLRHGRECPVGSSPLGTDVGAAIEKATALNEAFRQWRKGERARLSPGTVAWLFDWYRGTDKFGDLRHNTRAGYRLAMDQVLAALIERHSAVRR